MGTIRIHFNFEILESSKWRCQVGNGTYVIAVHGVTSGLKI